MQHPIVSRFAFVVAILAIAACDSGGSGSTPAATTTSEFVTWQSTGNSLILDVDGDAFSVRRDSLQVYDRDRQITIQNAVVAGSDGNDLLVDGVKIGNVYSYSPSNGQYSVFATESGYLLDIVFNGTGYVWTQSTSPRNGGGGGGGGGGLTFYNWVNSTNGTVVLDANNDPFRFRADTGQLFFSPYTITNCYVASGPAIYWNGQLIGAVTLVDGSAGGQVAIMVSNAGYLIDIYGSGGQFYWTETNLQASRLAPDPSDLLTSLFGEAQDMPQAAEWVMHDPQGDLRIDGGEPAAEALPSAFWLPSLDGWCATPPRSGAEAVGGRLALSPVGVAADIDTK